MAKSNGQYNNYEFRVVLTKQKNSKLWTLAEPRLTNAPYETYMESVKASSYNNPHHISWLNKLTIKSDPRLPIRPISDF